MQLRQFVKREPTPEWAARTGQILNPGLGLLVDLFFRIRKIAKRIVKRMISN
jgi:hypothetical protein